MPLRRLAGLYERGAVKYGDHNWQKGQPLMRYIDSAQRHMNMLLAGEATEDHAIGVVWNMFAYIWTENEIKFGRLPKELDNRPPPEPDYDTQLKQLDQLKSLTGMLSHPPLSMGCTFSSSCSQHNVPNCVICYPRPVEPAIIPPDSNA